MPTRRTALFGALALLTVLLAPAAAQAGFQDDLLKLINQERAKHNLKSVKLNSKINSAAQGFADYMRKHNKFSHSADGKSPGQRMTNAGYKWSACGEIIAKGYSTPASVVKGWMNSSGHRAIILSKSFTEIGCGKSGTYWVVDFGKAR